MRSTWPRDEQLAKQVHDPALAVALGGREGHPEEVELDARAAPDDRQVVVEMRVRVGVADDDPRRVRALVLEDPQLVEPDRRQHGVGRDRQAGPSGGPGRRAMDPLLLRRHPRLVGADLADDPGTDAGVADAGGRLARRARRRGRRPTAGRCGPPPGSTRRDTSRSP